MPDTLPALEKQKAQLLQEISQLGDQRRGSITTLTRRCGKPGCRCAQPDSPPHYCPADERWAACN